ncbi:MAG: error-prone DNA polymerase [Proteobacteria bacterium]|nr:error-prone DNA polymerase [Pseudomonadota bacterium]
MTTSTTASFMKIAKVACFGFIKVQTNNLLLMASMDNSLHITKSAPNQQLSSLSSGFVEWLAHTNFSFLLGASHPSELLDQSQTFGLSGFAVTDFDGVYGLARCFRHWRKMDPKLRPQLIYGAELHLDQDHDLPIQLQNTLSLIVRSASGYENMCKLITHCHRNGKYNAFISLEDLAEHDLTDLSAIIPMRGLIRRACSESPDSALLVAEQCSFTRGKLRFSDSSRLDSGNSEQALRKHSKDVWYKQLHSLKEMFKDDLYFAVSRHLNPAEDAWIYDQIEASQKFKSHILMTQDVFFHTPSRKPLSDTLHAIRTNSTLSECVDHMFANDQRTLLSPQDFHRRYSPLPFFSEAMSASQNLLKQIHFSFDELRYRYPKEMIPPNHTPHSYLTALTWHGAKDTFGDHLPPKVKETLERELALIETLGFADYFLTVWDIVYWARKQKILCQGRGSAANSAVCFVLGITAVDPSRFDLLFERFMSVERGDPPDIDVDFEHERREEVIQYIYKRYGRDKAAMVANVITFRRKGALRETGKALGIHEKILGEASDLIRSRVHAGKKIEDIVCELKATHADPIPWSLWIQIANQLKGFPRHLGIHSGGFMIADRPLTALVPYEPATMEGRSVVQWCKDDIEDLGFFKIDILALGMLTAVRKTLQMIKSHYGQDLTMSSIPQEDPATYQMIQKADTIGTFQIESRAQISMLPRMLPKTFYDLVIEVAIIRPGPIQGGMIHPFLRRRHGLEPITFPDERLRPILHRTLGIPIFQEQVMRIAMAIGNFTPGEANELRKNMGAWSMRGDINPWLVKLSEGMKANHIAPEFADAILAQMKGFAEYGFPESHSVSFALIAYVSAYLKRHYPAAFFTGLLNAQPMGFYSAHTLIQTAQRCGVPVLPMTVNQSNWDSTLEPLHKGTRSEFAIRLGLRLIGGLSQAAGRHIEKARSSSGPWATWQEFLKHTKIFRHDLTALAAANALSTFGLDRRAAIWMAAAAPHSHWLEDIESPLNLNEQTLQEQIQQDFNSFGTSLTAHPAKVIRDHDWCYNIGLNRIRLAKDIPSLIPNQIISVFGVIVIEQRPPSAKGMMFITLEDETGHINLVFTPDIIQKYAQALTGQSMLCISGKLQRQNAAHSILVKDIFSPKITQGDVIPLGTDRSPKVPPTPLVSSSSQRFGGTIA